jgi:hypothetical protein
MSEHLTQQGGDKKSSFIVTADIRRRSRDVLRRRERRREHGLAEQGREDGLAERGGMREHRWRRGVASTPVPTPSEEGSGAGKESDVTAGGRGGPSRGLDPSEGSGVDPPSPRRRWRGEAPGRRAMSWWGAAPGGIGAA